MATSQNMRFIYELQPDESAEHPAGESIAKLLRNGLIQRGWNATTIDNWRDCGWGFLCSNDEAVLRVVIAHMATKSHWLLQVSPKYCPGFIGRLFAKKPSASSNAVYKAAKDVHGTISGLEAFGCVHWCWDAVPNNDNSTEEPTSPLVSGK